MTSYKRFDSANAVAIGIDAATNHLTGDTYDHGNDTSYGPTGSKTNATYDALNMPTATSGAGGNAYYVYTADDERIGVLSGDTWTWSLRGFDHQVLRQYTSSSKSPWSPWTWIEDYVYGANGLLAAERVPEEGGRRHFHLDHLGTPRLVTSSTGSLIAQHDYTPFGLEITTQSQDLLAGFDREEPKRFTGHERDYLARADYSNATDYLHARSYSSASCRLLSVDRVGGDPREPLSWNRYSYVQANPTAFIDPDGRVVVGFTGFTGQNPTSAVFQIADALRQSGKLGPVGVFPSERPDQALWFVLNALEADAEQPVVVFGHSWGADTALGFAAAVGTYGKQVNVLGTIDPQGKWFWFFDKNREVPDNVALAVNFYQTKEFLGGTTLYGDAKYTSVMNLLVNASHTGMDDAIKDLFINLLLSGKLTVGPKK